ncbi:antigen identified by monoclonal antibody Ki-67 [Linnemannia zychae]|nr:antigen identified by monoclonal antibody Ki-67 [Linnemannia zychae]
MSETPKSTGRRQLRKSALQASPFGAPVKSFLKAAPPTSSSSSSSAYSTPTTTRIRPVSPSIPSLPAAETDDNIPEQPGSSSPLDSPTSRKSARISNMYKSMDLSVTPKKPPTTPRSKSHVKIGIWGHIVGLKKQDLSEYCRFPIDKSYCSFGRIGSNDVPVPFESVSDMHCKLIRREDGEVWLKDTSSIGTLLNNVLVHDTARPIEHNDIMTIAGRSFRFESVMPTPRQPLQATDGNTTPKRQFKTIQMSIEGDLAALAEAPSPTAGRTSTTPKRNPSRSTAALESSLGVFTPKSAAKLSSLLVSPKPIPLPAFLKSPRKPIASIDNNKNSITWTDSAVPNTHYDQLEQDDNPGYHTPTKKTRRSTEDNPGYHTPIREKRKSVEDPFNELGRTPKKVSFGPDLNPEIFSKDNPPNTPIKRGDHQPTTASTPSSFLSKLAAAGGTPKSILTPSRAGGRTNVIQGLEKPTPLKLMLFSPKTSKLSSTPKKQVIVAQDTASPASGVSTAEQDDNASDNSADGGDDNIRKEPESSSITNPFLESTSTFSKELRDDDGEQEDDDESAPSTPSRRLAERQSSATLSTPKRPRLSLSHEDVQEEHLHHSFKLHGSPVHPDADNPFISNDEPSGNSPSHSPSIAAVQRHHPEMADALGEELETPLVTETDLSPQAEPEIPNAAPVHTPIRNRHRDEQKSNVTPNGNTPGSASRMALLQLSAQKIRGLPDLLQSPSSSFTREALEPAPAIPEADVDEIESDQDDSADEEVTQNVLGSDDNSSVEEDAMPALLGSSNEVAQDGRLDEEGELVEEVDAQTSEAVAEDVDQGESVGKEAEAEANEIVVKDDQIDRTWLSSVANSKRRSSAPAASSIMQPQSPIFNGLRGVFRTPQKVVETCYAGFTGFRNFMTPTRSPKLPSTEPLSSFPETETQAVEEENPFQVDYVTNEKEEAVETLDVQDAAATSGPLQHGPELAEFTFSVGSPKQEMAMRQDSDYPSWSTGAVEADTPSNDIRSNHPTALPTTTAQKRRISTHEDAMALLTGRSGELSPKSKEFTFATDSLDKIKARGRRSDVFPQKRTVAKRSLSQTGDREGEKSGTDDNGDSRRRRTISMFEFMAAVSTSVTMTTVSSAKPDADSQEQDGEDAEEAELLRLLGEGADAGGDDDDESSEGDVEPAEDVVDNGVGDVAEGTDDAFLDVEEKTVKDSPRRRSGSFHSGMNTPVKRRQSFKSRMGSSSPGFGLYEQDGDEDEEDDEDDEVMMISPKRIRIMQ